MNDESIFTSLTGSCRSRMSEEYPVPKSSRLSATPSAARDSAEAAAWAGSLVSTCSLISSRIASGGRPVLASSREIVSARPTSSRSLAATFTETWTGSPSCHQREACARAISTTRAVRSRIRYECSTSGMNSSGRIVPRTGCRQRTSASIPAARRSPRYTLGWNCSSSSPRSMPRRRSLSSARRAGELRSESATYRSTPLRRSFARYIATSACCISSSNPVASSG